MSVHTYVEISCDSCAEHRRGPFTSTAARDLEADMLLHGWMITEGKFRCPRCVPKHGRAALSPVALVVGLVRQAESRAAKDILYSTLTHIQFPAGHVNNGTVAAWENSQIAREALV